MNDLALLWRSGSLSLVLNQRRSRFTSALESFTWNGRKVYYRPGSSDVFNIQQILLRTGYQRQYFFPDELSNPGPMLDIGANTGLVSIYLAHLYPEAPIYAFEPVPENFEILCKNALEYPNIKPVACALGKMDGPITLHAPKGKDDFVGYSAYEAGKDQGRSIQVSCRNLNAFLLENKVTRLGVIKIDAEGSEADIFRSLDASLLGGVTWMTGELHGRSDFELLGELSRDFHLGFRKGVHCRMTNFYACNKAHMEALSKQVAFRKLI